MDSLRRSGVRFTVAVLVGLGFHVMWAVLYIFSASHGASGGLRGLLWCVAPIITAAGYGLGLTLLPRLQPQPRTGFARAFVAALAGCVIGAVIGSPIGPMFVGFGILGGGAMAVAVRVVLDR